MVEQRTIIDHPRTPRCCHVELDALVFVINALIRDLTSRLIARGLATTSLKWVSE